MYCVSVSVNMSVKLGKEFESVDVGVRSGKEIQTNMIICPGAVRTDLRTV